MIGRFTALALLTFAASSGVGAADRSPLYELSQLYELKVGEFRQIVDGIRGIDRSDKRLVKRLHDEAKKLRVAARIPRHRNRLHYQWREVLKRHNIVGERLSAKYTPHHDVALGLEAMNFCLSNFASEYLFTIENPLHGREVRKVIDSNPQRRRFLEVTQSPLAP